MRKQQRISQSPFYKQNADEIDQKTEKNSLFGDFTFKEDDFLFNKNLSQSQAYNQFFQDIVETKNQFAFMSINEVKSSNRIFQQNQIQVIDNIVQDKQFIDQKAQFLKRNRQSAKMCRQKKKKYFQLLQKKNLQNQRKINDLTKRLRQTELQLNRLKNNSDKRTQSFDDVLQDKIQQLTKIIQSQQNKQALEQYQMEHKIKFGPAGKQRIELLNYLMSQYIEHLSSDCLKYFMITSIQKKGLFGKCQETQLDLDIRKVLQIDQIKKQKFSDKLQMVFQKASNQFAQLRQRLEQCHIDFANFAKYFEAVLLPIKRQISTLQNFSKLFIFFSQNAHRQDIRSLKHKWFTMSNKEEISIVQNNQIRKKKKLGGSQNFT